ncbi:MAG: CpaD family pilus assembly protein [Pseudomonadota bacterium]
MHNKLALRSLSLKIVLALILGGSVASCHNPEIFEPTTHARSAAYVADRHPIHVHTKGVEIKLHVKPNASRLTRRQKVKISRFLKGYKKSHAQHIEIAAPSGADNEIATFNVLNNIRDLLKRYNISNSSIDFVSYNAADQYKPAVYMAYGKYVAKGPECGEWPGNLVLNKRNVHYHNFGCATQRNLASMIANPRDLIQLRKHTARSSERRDVIWEKYIKGQSTGSQRSEDEKGRVSEVAK